MHNRSMMRMLSVLGLLFAAAAALFGDDAEAAKLYEEGRKLYLDGAYYKSGKIFAEAEESATSNAVKANSLLAQIGAWRMCELYYREFKAIEKILTLYPEYADFATLVNREYELGDEYSRGKRDPAFWALRFIPWLVEEDHSEEILKRAPERMTRSSEKTSTSSPREKSSRSSPGFQPRKASMLTKASGK